MASKRWPGRIGPLGDALAWRIEDERHGDAPACAVDHQRRLPGHATGDADRQHGLAGKNTLAVGDQDLVVAAHIHRDSGEIDFNSVGDHGGEAYLDLQRFDDRNRARRDRQLKVSAGG